MVDSVKTCALLLENRLKVLYSDLLHDTLAEKEKKGAHEVQE